MTVSGAKSFFNIIMGEFKYIIKEFSINNSVIIINVDLFSTPIFSLKKNSIPSKIFRSIH